MLCICLLEMKPNLLGNIAIFACVFLLVLALQMPAFCSSVDLTHPLSVVVVYSLSMEQCRICQPQDYIRFSLEHLALIQTKSNILFVSDIEACATSCGKKLNDILPIPSGVQYIDISKYVNKATNPQLAEFQVYSSRAFASEYLWLSSATRFFVLESLMKEYNISNVVHIEADNLIYGRFDEIFPTLKEKYLNLAATPLYSKAYIMTASVFWIPSYTVLSYFNHFLTNCLGKDDALWRRYLKFMRKCCCCRRGGMDPDERGNGIYNRSVNEMSVLGYYKYLHPKKLENFPMLPLQNFARMKFMSDDLNLYRPGGASVGEMLGFGVFDSGSYGQYIGGDSFTHDHRGFSEPKHLIGMALRLSSCRPVLLCTNYHNFSLSNADSHFKVIDTHILSPQHTNSTENLSRFPTILIPGGAGKGLYDLGKGLPAGQQRWDQYRAYFHGPASSGKRDENLGRTLLAVKCSSTLDDYKMLVGDSLTKTNFNPFPLKLANSDISATDKEIYLANKESVTTITPLWNMHVHSKHTWEFVTSICHL